ncbi:hypothetical protein [uncultured Draconibacterium sp.]|uniref:hypothetical protein n=1 Tax=uncultured Draconibacterium sp. TaxID=1573823 RepID=UPI0029C7A2A5|nr:hypothetical protein [uncultured Draconibacterium sp.]
MNYTEIINDPEGGELGGEKVVAITAVSGPLQLQITNDYDSAYIDLTVGEVEQVIAGLQQWVNEVKS